MRQYIPDSANLIPRSAELVYSGIIFDVYHWEQKLFDGSSTTFEMLKRPDTVQVIAIDRDQVVYLEQKQPGRQSFISLPGGRADNENETELEAIQRELKEETGLVLSDWKLIHCFQPQSKIDWLIYTFIASGVQSHELPRHDGGEKIIVKRASLLKFKKLAMAESTRFFPWDVLDQVHSVDGFQRLPALQPSN